MKILLFLLTGIILNNTAVSQNALQGRLDSCFSSLFRYGMINGNVLIAENGKIVYEKSFGFSDFKNKLPNNDFSEFTLGSVSKTLTSTAILQLLEKGKLKLDNPLIKYFPEFPYPEITIRHLLSHTSGLPDYDLYKDQMDKSPNKIFTIQDILPSLKIWKQPLHFKPGEKWQYVNTNFCLLALLVEKISGLEFQKYMEKFIFEPAKMSSTYFQRDPLKKRNRNRTINYEYPWLFSAKMEPADSIKRNYWRSYNASGFVGQGNIMTTTEDLLKFDDALYSGKILKPSTLAEAFVPSKLSNGQNVTATNGIGNASYGLGWFIFNDTSAGKIVWHSGGVPGGLSIFLRNITKRQTVIAFDNTFNKGLYIYGANAMNILNYKPLIHHKISLSHEYGITLIEKGPDVAFCELFKKKVDTLHYYLDEDDMNELGLQILYAATFANHKELALEVLKLNILLFPNGFNTYDSYGEALVNIGKKEEAIFMYQKSIELNPENEGGKKALKELNQK
jgi:CubicO group peptidase (beta-lactamase class C family)